MLKGSGLAMNSDFVVKQVIKKPLFHSLNQTVWQYGGDRIVSWFKQQNLFCFYQRVLIRS